MLRQKQPSLHAAVQEYYAVLQQLHDVTRKAILYSTDLQRLAKFSKRLGQWLDEVADTLGLEPAVGAQAIKVIG